MRKLISLVLLLFILTSVQVSYAVVNTAAIVAAAAATNAARIHREEEEAQQAAHQNLPADAVTICPSDGKQCNVLAEHGGCGAYDNISFDEYLKRTEGAEAHRVGIAYNDYDRKMQIYYRRDK